MTLRSPVFLVATVAYSVVDRVFKAAEWILELNGFIHDDNYTTPELQGADASACGASKRGSDVSTSHKCTDSKCFILFNINNYNLVQRPYKLKVTNLWQMLGLVSQILGSQ